jgi:AsmA protein
MKKQVKWIFICVIGLALSAVAGVISLPFLVDPNDYKTNLTELVRKQTGQTLLIPGDIELKVTPRLDIAFSLGEIRLVEANNSQKTPFASSKLAKLNLALWPLLSKKQLVIKNLLLHNVQLNLVRNQNGRGNWENLITEKRKEKAPLPVQDGKRAVPKSEQQPVSLDIGGVEIKNINIHYKDLATGHTVAVENFNLTLGHLIEAESFPVAADFQLYRDDNVHAPLTARISLAGNLTMFLRDKRFILKEGVLQGTFKGKDIPSEKQTIELLADASIDLKQEKINTDRLVVKQGAMNVKTAFTLTGFKSPAINGTLEIAEFSPRKQFGLLDLDIPEFSDPETLTSVSGLLSFHLKDNNLSLEDINLHVDDTSITAKAVVNNLKNPAYDVNMSMDRIDLDRYTIGRKTPVRDDGPEKKTENTSAREKIANTSRSGEKIVLPVQQLRKLNYSARIKIGALKAADIRASNIFIKSEADNGLVRLQPLRAELYDGSLQVSGILDTRKEIPEMQLEKELKDVQLGPLFVDLTGKEEITGRANISAKVTTRGLTRKELAENADGTLKLSLDNGRIAKLQILQTIRMAKALLEKKPMPRESETHPAGFAVLTADGTLTNGVFTSNNLVAQSDLMKVTGKGMINFVNQQIDYLLTVYLTSQIERNEETGLVSLANTPIPYRIKGSFAKLEQSAALDELLKSKAKQMLMDELQNRMEPGKKKNEKNDFDTGSLIKKGLNGLFGN